MPFNRNHVNGFLAKTEIDLFVSSLGADLKGLKANDVQRRIDRTRKLRDKYRDLLKRQKLATRARTGTKMGSGNANERTEKKAKAFDEALGRFEAQAKALANSAKLQAKQDAQQAKKTATKASVKASAKSSGTTTSKSPAKAPTKKAAAPAATKRTTKPLTVPAIEVLRRALEVKKDKEAAATAAPPSRSRKAPAPAAPVGAADGYLATAAPDLRAIRVARRLDQSGLARIQGHTGTQVRHAQAKRDSRGGKGG